MSLQGLHPRLTAVELVRDTRRMQRERAVIVAVYVLAVAVVLGGLVLARLW